MAIVFYAARFSSALPVGCALHELDVPHQRIDVDLAANEQKRPEFLKLNPNGKVPTLVVDGTPMFEALAICQWLGDRFGVERKLWPAADSPARMTALAWTTWAYASFGSVLNRYQFAQSERVAAEFRNPALAEFTQKELQQLLGILDGWLGDRNHLLGDGYSLADLVVACVVRYGTLVGVGVDGHRHLKAWLDRCHARPALRAEWG
jgi:GST-like protein